MTTSVLPVDFSESLQWPEVLDLRLDLLPEPAVYALLHEAEFSRLRGSSRVLYIGATGELGGTTDRCRLRTYRYPNGEHARELKRRVDLLVASGVRVTLTWKYVATKQEAVSLESALLAQYLSSHWELPPFNGTR
jgi:hypothetical protein